MIDEDGKHAEREDDTLGKPIPDETRLDEAIVDAWDDIHVTSELKASTMAAIHAAAGRQETASGPVPVGSAAPAAATGMVDLRSAAGERTTSSARRGHRRAHGGHRLFYGLVAAVLCLALVGTAGGVVYNTETAYASVSAQTSVELGVNRFGRVISVEAQDAAQQGTIDDLGLVGMEYGAAMSTLAESGCLGAAEVDVTVSGGSTAQEQQMVEASTDSLAGAGCSGTCNGNRYGKRDGSGGGMGDGTGSGSGSGSGMMGGSGSGSGSGSGMMGGSGNGSGSGMMGGSGNGSGSGNRWGQQG